MGVTKLDVDIDMGESESKVAEKEEGEEEEEEEEERVIPIPMPMPMAELTLRLRLFGEVLQLPLALTPSAAESWVASLMIACLRRSCSRLAALLVWTMVDYQLSFIVGGLWFM